MLKRLARLILSDELRTNKSVVKELGKRLASKEMTEKTLRTDWDRLNRAYQYESQKADRLEAEVTRLQATNRRLMHLIGECATTEGEEVVIDLVEYHKLEERVNA